MVTFVVQNLIFADFNTTTFVSVLNYESKQYAFKVCNHLSLYDYCRWNPGRLHTETLQLPIR